MKAEAVKRIMLALTPTVSLEACLDAEDGIVATVRHEYLFEPTLHSGYPMTKTINVKADKDGKILEAVGLF